MLQLRTSRHREIFVMTKWTSLKNSYKRIKVYVQYIYKLILHKSNNCCVNKYCMQGNICHCFTFAPFAFVDRGWFKDWVNCKVAEFFLSLLHNCVSSNLRRNETFHMCRRAKWTRGENNAGNSSFSRPVLLFKPTSNAYTIKKTTP